MKRFICAHLSKALSFQPRLLRLATTHSSTAQVCHVARGTLQLLRSQIPPLQATVLIFRPVPRHRLTQSPCPLPFLHHYCQNRLLLYQLQSPQLFRPL